MCACSVQKAPWGAQFVIVCARARRSLRCDTILSFSGAQIGYFHHYGRSLRDISATEMAGPSALGEPSTYPGRRASRSLRSRPPLRRENPDRADRGGVDLRSSTTPTSLVPLFLRKTVSVPGREGGCLGL